MSVKTHSLLGVALVGLAVLLSGTVGGLARDLATSSRATVEVRPAGSSTEALELMAVGLARDLRAVDSVGELGRCPVEDLRVRWVPIDGGIPLGVSGSVVCPGLDEGVLTFEARRVGRGWSLFPVPLGDVVEAMPLGVGLEFALPTIDLVDLPADLAAAVDAYAGYEPQRLCDPTVKPGTRALAGLLLAAVPGTGHLGITRDCSLGPTSEHKEGRAFDWAVAPSQRGEVERVLARLLATDPAGNPHALARRMGVMYIVWDGRIWASYRADEGWRPFPGPNPHEGHVHISLSRDGAAGRTTLWQAGVAAGWWTLPPPAAPAPVPIAVVGQPPPATPVAAPPRGFDPTPPTPDEAVADLPAPTPMRRMPPPRRAEPTPTRPAPAPSPGPTLTVPQPPDPTPRPSPSVPPPPGPTEERPPEPTEEPPPEPTEEPSPGTTEEPSPETPTPPTTTPVRVLVRLTDDGADPSPTDGIRDEAGAVLVHRSRLLPGLETWQVAEEDVEAVVAGLVRHPEVARAEVDATIVATELPVSHDAAGPVVAVIGADAVPDDPALAAKLWSNPAEVAGNGIDDDENGYVDDVHGWRFCPAAEQEAIPSPDGTPDPEAGPGESQPRGDEPDGARTVRVAPLTVVCADDTGRLSDALAALDYAVAAGIPTSVNSWVVVGEPSALLAEAVTAAEQAGHVVVMPADLSGRLP